MAKVAVIATVLNEQESIRELITSLKHQTLFPTEVIIVDGKSTDNTWKILVSESQRWPLLKIYQHPGNRSSGRNFAISRAKSPLIAITDAGCVPDSTWLAEITKPFSDPAVEVVSGYYHGLAKNVFQACLVPYVLVMSDRAQKTEFFPSTRSMALRKSVWTNSGGFDANLVVSEDYAYAHKLKRLGYSFIFAPNAIVGWHPRKNLSQAAWMFMHFAICDIHAGLLRPQVKLLAIRYLVALFIFFYLWELNRTTSILYLVFAFFVYSFWAISKNYKYVKRRQALFWLPLLQYTADICVMFGTLIGFLSRPAWATKIRSS